MRSIRRDMGIGLSITVVLTGLVAGFIYYSYSVGRAEQELEDHAQQVKDSMTGSIAVHLWTFDTDQIHDICMAAMQSGDISGLKVTDEKGEIVFSRGLLTGSELISLSHQMNHNGHPVGNLEVAFFRQGIHSSQKNILTTMLVVTLCVVGSVIIIMQFLLGRFLSGPLSHLKRDVERLSEGDWKTTLLTDPRTEISNIISAFNSLADKLAMRDKEVRKKTNSLELVNAELSLEIKERKQVEEALQQELDLNTSLAEVSGKMIFSSGSIALVSHVVLDKILQLTGSEHGFVGSIDPASGNLVAVALTEMWKDSLPSPETDQWVISRPQPDGAHPTLWGHSMNTKIPLISNDPHTHPVAQESPPRPTPLRNFLSVPVLFEGDLVGQLGLANSIDPYTQQDIDSLTRFADLWALAVKQQRDSNDKASLQEDLRQAQKMEAIGTLAGGIAHDFNNILTALLGYGELALDTLPEKNQAADCVGKMLTAGERAKELVQKILAFSRHGESVFQPVYVQKILTEALALLRASIPANIEIRQDISAECGPVNADPTQIHQVVMNLCTNGYQAMQEKGGQLTISLQETDVSPNQSTSLLELPPRSYVQLKISDTGPGMDETTLKRIFDPYFTTKEVGKGTGMGLAVVHGIIKGHQGNIIVRSNPDQGTVFTISLPRTENPVANPEEFAPEDLLHWGSERILFIDDEKDIVEMSKIRLSRFGFSVTGFEDSREALSFFQDRPEDFDLIITDMAMPFLTGKDLAQKVFELRADMPIILCSGFSEQVNRKTALEMGFKDYLAKPVGKFQMVAAIRKIFG